MAIDDYPSQLESPHPERPFFATNRVGVARVTGYDTARQTFDSSREVPELARIFIHFGVYWMKFWCAVSQREQRNCFAARDSDPARCWEPAWARTELMRAVLNILPYPSKETSLGDQPDPLMCGPATVLSEYREGSGGSFPLVR